MSEYTKRTCTKCGKRDIQPNMNQIEVEYTSGSSNAGMTGRTILGAMFEDKKSQKQLNNWIWGNSKRTYKRRRKVWVCDSCAGVRRPGRAPVEQKSSGKSSGRWWKWFLVICVVAVIVGALPPG